MRCARPAIGLIAVVLSGCGGLRYSPDTHGPGWVGRPADSVLDKFGNPDRTVRLPPPSLTTVYLYTGGAEPGFAMCERNYYVRGGTVIGYAEHGADPACNRKGGRTE